MNEPPSVTTWADSDSIVVGAVICISHSPPWSERAPRWGQGCSPCLREILRLHGSKWSWLPKSVGVGLGKWILQDCTGERAWIITVIKPYPLPNTKVRGYCAKSFTWVTSNPHNRTPKVCLFRPIWRTGTRRLWDIWCHLSSTQQNEGAFLWLHCTSPSGRPDENDCR